jgi:hypothetical protein
LSDEKPKHVDRVAEILAGFWAAQRDGKLKNAVTLGIPQMELLVREIENLRAQGGCYQEGMPAVRRLEVAVVHFRNAIVGIEQIIGSQIAAANQIWKLLMDAGLTDSPNVMGMTATMHVVKRLLIDGGLAVEEDFAVPAPAARDPA